MPAQVSELSHKLGSAQGSSKSLEQEVAQLRSQVQQLSSEKHSLEMQLSDTRAKLCAAQEKVRRDAGWCALAASSAVPCTSRSPGVGCRTPCGSTHTVCFPGPGRGAAAGAARRPGGCRVPVGGPLQRPARPGDGARGALQGGSGRGGQGQRHHPAAAGEGRGGGGGGRAHATWWAAARCLPVTACRQHLPYCCCHLCAPPPAHATERRAR
jgi:outer membrane murein-binding lipoprotein Lpp